MVKGTFHKRSNILVNDSREGERLEAFIAKRMKSKEGFDNEAPIIHTERKAGVEAGYNIRTDRFEVALDAIDTIQASEIAKSESKPTVEDTEKGGDNTTDEGGLKDVG